MIPQDSWCYLDFNQVWLTNTNYLFNLNFIPTTCFHDLSILVRNGCTVKTLFAASQEQLGERLEFRNTQGYTKEKVAGYTEMKMYSIHGT